MRNAALAIVGFVAGWILHGCGPSVEARDATAASYQAALIACVNDASTASASDACRKDVDKRFGVDAGVGGAR